MSIVRSAVRSPVRSPVRSVLGDDVFGPASLFSSGAQGAWYDPSDFSTLFQDSAGSTPVTAVEQPVRLMRDRSGRGNDATAPNDASRPVLRARYNLLTQSDDLTSFIITPATGLTSTLNATTAPTGAATARRLTNTVTTEQHRLFQSETLTSGAEYTYTVYLKNDTAGWAQISFYRGGASTAFANINLATGALGNTGGGTSYSVTSVGNGWYRLSVTATTEAAGCNFQLYVLEADEQVNPTTTGTVKSIFVWGAQLLTAADQTSTGGAYQRIAAATSYDTSNPVFRPYLAFDGSDDNMDIASSIHDVFQNVGSGTMWVGGQGSATDQAYVLISVGAGAPDFSGRAFVNTDRSSGRRVDGNASANAIDAGYVANTPYVATNISDWAGGNVIRRTNGVQVASTAYAGGAGNTSNTASNRAVIGVNGTKTASWLNGRLYSAIILGRAATTAELTATEQWINGKTGAY